MALNMSVLHARVRNGQLHLDTPTSIPEGAALKISVDDEDDDLDATDRVALDLAISRTWAAIQAGQRQPAAKLLASLRRAMSARRGFR
jgi:hypothetical protein